MHSVAVRIARWWSLVKNMSRRSKYTSVFVFFLILGAALLLTPSIAHAQIEKDTIAGGIIIALTEFFLWLASLGIQLAIFFLKFFILLAGYNGFINASIVKFGWNIVRDVANMFFIVILLVIAFGTILGLEQYEWKKSLPKLVFAAIFVNFSNVICQLIIDVSQVFTITFLNAVAGTAGGNLINIMNFNNVMKLIADGPPVAGQQIDGDIIIGALMAVFFCFIAAASIGSYMIVMLYRMVTLWCLIILSPLAFLFSVLPTTQSYADEFWKEFINHVIAAPMMVFFLWLAFATFGRGDVVETDIQNKDNNGLVEQGYTLDVTDAQAVGAQSSVSVSDASSWLNMANFAVAIGFLYLGIERVQRLGVRGGDYIQRATDFAKKAFTIGVGYDIGRHLAGKGKSGIIGGGASLLGSAYNKVPIIGGDSLKRKWTGIKGRANLLGVGIANTRDKLAASAEKLGGDSKLAKYMGAGVLGSVLGSAIQSGARADKRARNWEKAGEDAWARWDEQVSTSNTASGKAKLDQGVKLEIAQDLSAAKKAEKFAKRREELLRDGAQKGLATKLTGSNFQAMAKETAKTKARAANLEHALHGEAEAEQAREDARLRGDLAVDTTGMSAKEAKKITKEYRDAGHKAHGLHERANKSKAETEQLQKQFSETDEVAVAIARDNWLKSKNRIGEAVYERNVRTKQTKEAAERQSVGDYDLSLARTTAQLAAIQSASSPEQLAELQKGLAQMGLANDGRLAAFGDGNRSKVLKALGVDQQASMVIDEENIRRRQAQWLASRLGEDVQSDATGLTAAFEKFKAMFGENQQAVLEQELLALNKSAGEGSVGNAGLLMREVSSDGKITVRLSNGNTDRDHIQAKRTNAMSTARITSISGLGGSADRDTAGNVRVDSEQSKEVISDMVSRLTGNNLTQVDEFTIQDLASIAKNSDETKLLEMFQRIKAKNANTAVAKRLFEQVLAKIDDANPTVKAEGERKLRAAIASI